MRRIRFRFGSVELDASLADTPTADAIWKALPFSGRTETWGEEVHFSTPVAAPQEQDARVLLKHGEVAFSPPGNSIAVCFGPTPISRPGELRLAHPSNVFATLDGDPKRLAGVVAGARVDVARLEER